RNRFPDVLDAAHPGRAALNAHAEPAVRHAAVTTQIEIPLESIFRQAMRRDLRFEKLDRSRSLAAADHFAIAFRREYIHTKRKIVSFRIALHVESLDRRRIAMNHHGP